MDGETNEILQLILSKISSLDVGQQEIKQHLDKLDLGQAKLEAGQAKLEEGQARLETRLTKVEDGQAKLEEGQARLEARLTKVEEGQAKLEAGQAKLEEGQARLEARLTKVEVRLFNVEARLSQVEQYENKMALNIENTIEPNIKLIYENQITIIGHNKKLASYDARIEVLETDVYALKCAFKA